MSKKILVNYFAFFREQRGLSSEHCSTEAATLHELYEELKRKHGFALSHAGLKVAKNNEFASWDTPVESGDEIAFIPPVAGG